MSSVWRATVGSPLSEAFWCHDQLVLHQVGYTEPNLLVVIKVVTRTWMYGHPHCNLHRGGGGQKLDSLSILDDLFGEHSICCVKGGPRTKDDGEPTSLWKRDPFEGNRAGSGVGCACRTSYNKYSNYLY